MGRHAAPDIDASLRYAAELDLLLEADPAAAEAAAQAANRGEPWTATRRQLREAREARRASSRRGRYLALVVVLPLMGAALTGTALLWPGSAVAVLRAAHTQALTDAGVSAATGTVLTVRTGACPTAAADLCTLASVQVHGATGTFAQVSLGSVRQAAGVATGDELRLLRTTGADGEASYVVTDVVRDVPVALIGLALVVILLLLARWRGLGAIAGLAVGYAVIGLYALPALLAGSAPSLVGLTAAALILAPLLYLTQGMSMRSTTALAGALLGLGVSAGVGVVTALAGRLTGFDALGIGDYGGAPALGGLVDLPTLVLCGVLLAGVGVLADVTATQARAVWELHEREPRMRPLELYLRGVRVGRIHLATSVPTLAFSTAGALLPMLLLMLVEEPSVLRALTGERVAQELVRLAAGAAGVLVAVPVTTALAAFVAAGRRR